MSCNDTVYFKICLMKLHIGVHYIAPLWENLSLLSEFLSRYEVISFRDTIRDYRHALVNQYNVLNIITEGATSFWWLGFRNAKPFLFTLSIDANIFWSLGFLSDSAFQKIDCTGELIRTDYFTGFRITIYAIGQAQKRIARICDR